MNLNTLLTIDYLILNLTGDLYQSTQITSHNPFTLIDAPYGTKTFSQKHILQYKDETLGTLLSVPRSNIIPEKLIQFQFENHVFYTKSLEEIKAIISELTDFYQVEFTSINRLDIAFDINDADNYYRKLNNDITNGVVLLSGRKKSFSSYSELVKGTCINNGFSLGSRTSSKFLRVYNKSLSLEINEKAHIMEWYKANDFSNQNVWRFEMQLNASFFTNLKNFGHDKDFYDQNKEKAVLPFEDCTWSIFDYGALLNLVIMANKNFFELRTNTGKSQINKEDAVSFILDFEYLLSIKSGINPTFVKLKTTNVPSIIKKKRLAKALFREYYANFQNVSYIIALNRVLSEINPFNNLPLTDWFNDKMKFYLAEFNDSEKLGHKFDYNLYYEQSNLFID